MNEKQDNDPAPLASSSRRRVLLLGALLGATALAAGLGYAVWPRRAKFPEPPTVVLGRADAEMAQAIESARNAVLEEPRSAAAWGRLGMVLHAQDFDTEANVCYVQAEELDPRDPRWPYLQVAYLVSLDLNAALRNLERAVERCGTVTAPRLALGEMLLRLDRPGEAEPHFRRVLKADPKDPRANLGLARLAHDRGDWQTSLDHLQRSAAAAPQMRATHVLLAEVYYRLGDEPAADRERRLSAELPDNIPWPDPYNEQVAQLRVGVRARVEHANVLFKQGRSPEAVAFLQETVQKHPEAHQSHLALGRTLNQLARSREAEQALREAARLQPNSADVQFELGLALQQQKQYAAAAECYQKATELKPLFANAYYNLGLCLNEQGDRAGAIQALRTTVRYKPDYGPCHKNLGFLLAEEGQDAEALVHLQQALDLLPLDKAVQALLTQVRSRIRQPGM